MLRLRPYKKCDAKYIVSWLKDEVQFRKWCADRFEQYPISAEDMNNHYAQFEDTDELFPMTAFDEDGVVGHLFMWFRDDKKKIVRFGYVVVDDTKRGKGLGKELLKLAIQYAFEILKVEKITLGVFENNTFAHRCYQSVGFREIENGAHFYRIFDEDWKGLELELLYEDYVEVSHEKSVGNNWAE